MNIYEKLRVLSNNPSKEKKVKLYLLACCERFVPYRSKGNLEKGIRLAKLSLRGHQKRKAINDILWVLEAEAFEVDHYIIGIADWPRLCNETRIDLVKIRCRYQLKNRESLTHLRDVAYFVDLALRCVIFTDNDIPDEEYNNFMCPILFKRCFGEDA